jgi:hypothetical protein
MPKLFFYTIAIILLTFGISEARNCTGEVITLKSGWTLVEDPMYCAPKTNNTKPKKSSPAEFLNYIVKNICHDSQNVEDFQKGFRDNENNLSIIVKGRCNDGKKHGNITFSTNEEHLFTTKFRNDEVIKTSCTIKGDNTDFMDCFFYYIKNYVEK